MPRPFPLTPELRRRAIRLKAEQPSAHGLEWAAVRSIVEELGGRADALQEPVNSFARIRRAAERRARNGLAQAPSEGMRSATAKYTETVEPIELDSLDG